MKISNDEAIKSLNTLRESINGVFDYNCRKQCTALNMAIKALEQTSWIPVSEKLPERNKEVIVTDIETSDTYLSRYIGNGYWECDNGLFENRIIAWMPLPEQYKAERSEKA